MSGQFKGGFIMSLNNAGESGTEITGDINDYLVEGYLPTIGIECHVQLNTKTKLFSATDNDAREAEPNSKVSEIDYALPGMLPMLNHGAIKMAVRAGKALNSKIAKVSHFDRKHYFYPDLPKGYQISQLYEPLIIGGLVELPSGEKVRIHHAHVEEDAGKLTHFDNYSLVDLNRAGTPLIEIVSEPDIHSAKMARNYVEELHLLMTYAKVTIGNLYHGHMRFDVNISVAKPNDELGIRTELKNLNSFRAVERATEYEIKRQISLLNQGQKVTQQTRGWNEAEQKTFAQRGKEDAQDYRYMPDADIPPVILSDNDIKEMQKDMPIMPAIYRQKFKDLSVDSSVEAVILSQQSVAELISGIIDQSDIDHAKKIANLFASALPTDSDSKNTDLKLPSVKDLVDLANMLAKKEISSTAGKEIFLDLMDGKTNPQKIAKDKNLLQVSDSGALAEIVDQVLALPSSAKAIDDYKSGEVKVIGFLVGQVMKRSGGKANPSLAKDILKKKLD